ncbi:MAG: ATP-binding protein [Lachnospiraceae bacterium]|nr:ATP-binding protein [Lachnospiraceae bacterium]
MLGKARLPMGIEDFKRIRTDGFYYIDKTRMIRDLLDNMAYVNLFTRPRRFGKTLNMSMLKHFFDIGSAPALFDGLEISKEAEICDRYQGKFPVISISLKNVGGSTFDKAKNKLQSTIGNEAIRFSFLSDSDRLSETERRQFAKLIELNEEGDFAMSEGLLENSLLLLSRFLQKHYGQNTVILIDEYDVPLDKAYQAGYYDAMVELVRNLFGQALKTNNSLFFAVLTGCLRISKESIFSGFNNFKVYTVKDVRYKEYFGFTDVEVRQMIEYYGFASQYKAIKEWYDGYLFGDLSIYCPWDVINYCGDLRDESVTEPQNYWVNTSSNSIIRKFIDKADGITRNEIERLVNGESIRKKVRQELTYRDLDSKIDNLWSILFTTGYLTQLEQDRDGMTELIIPNKEIRWIFREQIQEWFETETRKDKQKLEDFCRAFEENDTEAIEKGFTFYLRKMISIRDTNVKKEMKENFYHGVLLGLFAGMEGWKVMSNAEAGDGYSDISVEVEDKEIGIVIELKYAEKAAFDEGCREALWQINNRNYEELLLDDGMTMIRKYGIACYKKRCRVISG